jgi:hypothetical protein
MAKEMEPRRWAEMDQPPGQDVDQAALIAAILAQSDGRMVPVAGPDWASQFRPPAVPGTIQDKYAKASLPARFLAFCILWVTWDWKRGAFVAVVVLLIAAIFVTR